MTISLFKTTKQKMISILITLFLALFFVSPVTSQAAATSSAATEATETTEGTEPAETTEAPETDAAADALSKAGEFHLGEDPTVWVMLAISVLALVVTLERIWVLLSNGGHNQGLVRHVTDVLSQSPTKAKIDELAETINAKHFGLEGRVAAVTLKGWFHGEKTMGEYSHAALTAERRALDKNLVILSTLGNNTPFIGLLGTVLGIMKSFRDLASSGGGPEVVMKGISEALIATAMGLGVAIPVVIAFNALATAVKNKLSNAEEISTLLRAIRMSNDTGMSSVVSEEFYKAKTQTAESSSETLG